MITISPIEARARFRTLPESLRDAIFSTQTSEVIDHIAEQNHLSKEKAAALSGVVGWILLGFLHKEDVAQEITEVLGTNQQMGMLLGNEVEKRIAQQFRAELDRIYTPAGTFRSASTKKPSNVSDIVSIASPQKTQIPTTPEKGSLPAPFIIHSESEAIPIGNTGKINLTTPQKLGGAFAAEVGKRESSMRSFFEKPARIDVGGTSNVIPPSPPRVAPISPNVIPAARLEQSRKEDGFPIKSGMTKATETPRAVNYGEIKTPIHVPIPMPRKESEAMPPPSFIKANEIPTARPPLPTPPKLSVAMMQSVHPSVGKEIIPAHLPHRDIVAELESSIIPEKELPAGDRELELPTNEVQGASF